MLASLTAIAAALLGLVAGVGGLALALAWVSTSQPTQQLATAVVLLLTASHRRHAQPAFAAARH